MGLGCYEGRDYQSTTPKPVVDLLGPTDRIAFRMSGKSVHVLPDTG